MMSAVTPTVTPSVEMSEMTEMNACLRARQQVAEGDVKFEGHRLGYGFTSSQVHRFTGSSRLRAFAPS